MGFVRSVTVILNRSSGIGRRGAPEDQVRHALSEAGISDVRILPLQRGLRIEAEGDAVIAAGGDGTVSAVAAALAGTEVPLGVLPAGTLNHFARDLGIPAGLDEAARVIAAGDWVCIDVARLNGRVFINNSSIGLYPVMVGKREVLVRLGWPKYLATVAGSLAALRQFPNTTVRLRTGGHGIFARTPFVFVGNNAYSFSGVTAGTRKTIADGELQVCTVRKTTRLGLVASALRLLAGGSPQIYTEYVTEARVETMLHHVKVALDGEVVRVDAPLEYSVWPQSLRVLAPRPTQET